MKDVDAAKFQRVSLNDIPTIEDLTKANNILYHIDNVTVA